VRCKQQHPTAPADIRARITTVCTDIWDGYISAAQEVLPGATIVIDRFHIARQYRDGVDALRKQEVRRLKSRRKLEAARSLKNAQSPTCRLHAVLASLAIACP